MDGRKGGKLIGRRSGGSLQTRLSLWLSVAVVTIAVSGGIFSFVYAFQEANELQDDQLRQVAAMLNRHDLPVPAPDPTSNEVVDDPEAVVIVQSIDARGVQIIPGPLALPANLSEGIQTQKIADEPWRLFVRTRRSGERLVIAQQTAVRDENAWESSMRTVMPLLALIPILIGLINIVVRRMLLPVARLSQEVDVRVEHDLRPLESAAVPDEIRPLVESISRLLLRVEQSVDLQRHFIAAAAHELRSPLTALSLQAENLAAIELSSPARMRLRALQQGLGRTKALVEQLLSFAQTQSGSGIQRTPILLEPVVRQAIEEIMPIVDLKRIEIDTHVAADTEVFAVPADIATLFRNLVGNAVRYTPSGGIVELSCIKAGDVVMIEVQDSGPGISAHEREQVFEPFYRVLGSGEEGSGLGLSIVKMIVARLGGEIVLCDSSRSGATGLKVCVSLPVTSTAPHVASAGFL